MAPAAFVAVAVAVAVAAVGFTWQRLFVGMDLQDESFYVLVPWRWALGDTPFVHEENLAQIPGLLAYPFVKAFYVFRGGDVTGLILYTRHLYLLMMIAVAVVAFFFLRRLVRWELALVIASVFVTFLFWDTPQLSYNTMGAAFLTLGAVFGAWVVVHDGGRRWALASGAAYGLAVVAYPTLFFIVVFYAVFFAFAQGRRAVAMVAEGAFSQPPDPEGPPTGLPAWRALSFWALGGALVLVPTSLIVLSFGLHNVVRCWHYTMDIARSLDQLGGAAKAVVVVQGFWRFFWSRPYLILAALVVYFVYRRWPRLGRALLATLPVALWLAAQRPILESAGFVLAYAFLAPYFFLFVPRWRREVGAKLLIWIWAPGLIAGAMTSYTSAEGYPHAPVGLYPAMLASGLFLAWALEAVARPPADEAEPPPPRTAGEELGAGAEAPHSGAETAGRPLPWLAMAVLVAVVALTIAFQFQFQQRDVPYSQLTKRCDFGPWWGIKLTPERYALLRSFDTDLRTEARPGDQLLVFYQACGYYLFWQGDIAANSYWLSSADLMAPLPRATLDYYRRHHVVPTLVSHVIHTAPYSPAELREGCGGLGYPATLVRPTYTFQRKPPGESTHSVIMKLAAAQAGRP